MKTLLRILTGLALVLALFVAAGFLLPREITASRTVLINAAPGAVFPHVNSLKAMSKWSPWSARDPQMKTLFSGPESGVGASMSWSSDNPEVGTGTQIIVASTPDQSMEMTLDFGEMGQGAAGFELVPEGDGTSVTWNFSSDLGMNPIARWFGLMIGPAVEKDYEQGLAKLKAAVEKG